MKDDLKQIFNSKYFFCFNLIIFVFLCFFSYNCVRSIFSHGKYENTYLVIYVEKLWFNSGGKICSPFKLNSNGYDKLDPNCIKQIRYNFEQGNIIFTAVSVNGKSILGDINVIGFKNFKVIEESERIEDTQYAVSMRNQPLRDLIWFRKVSGKIAAVCVYHHTTCTYEEISTESHLSNDWEKEWANNFYVNLDLKGL